MSSFKRILPLAIAIELAGLCATFYGYFALKRSAEEADADRFKRLVEVQMADISARLDSYESVLYGGIGLLNGSEDVSPEEWSLYVSSIPLELTAPGILGMGTISPVSADQRADKILEYAAEYGDNFVYKTVGGANPPSDMSYIIDRIEPLSRNLSALGLDIGSEINRKTAFEKARDTGHPQVTGTISLVQDDQDTPGFLLIIPRYRISSSPDTVEERRAAFMDVVYAPMIAKNILNLPSRADNTEINFAVYDEVETPDKLIYSSAEIAGLSGSSYQQIVNWPYAGREWLIHTWTTPNFVSKKASRQQLGFLLVGVTLSTSLALVLLAIHRSHRKALSLVETYKAEAKENESINNLFVEYAPAAIAIFDQDLCYLSSSRRWMNQFGLDSNIRRKRHHDVFREIQGLSTWKESFAKALSGERLKGGPDPFVRSDGETLFLVWEILPWNKSDGVIGGIVTFALDVTETENNRQNLIHAKQELQIVEERLRQATDAGNVGIWDWHIETGELLWNDKMYALFGVCEVAHRVVEDFIGNVHPDDRGRVERALQDAITKIADYELEYRTNRPDHPTVLAKGKVNYNDRGEPTRMVGVCVDVSAQIRIRQELTRASEQHAEARREAEKMMRAREQFLATMSHELRTPMNGIIGMSDLLAATNLDAVQRDFTETIIECGQAMLALINDILELSKIEAGGIQIEKRPFDPVKMVERVLRIATSSKAAKNLRIDYDIDPALPNSLLGDENRLHQVMLNLMSNSIKFTESGHVRLAVKTGGSQNGEVEVIFEISDSGVGMSPAELERVMLPFVQADASTTRKYGGTGLGLSISRSLMHLMGGSLDLESAPGIGTTAFARVFLPLAPAEKSPDLSNKRPVQSPDAGKPPLLINRLLIVEDNPINQRVTEFLMMPKANTIEVVADGQQAVEKCKQNRYDLILMDCQMPIMDGYEATELIRKDETVRGLEPCVILALTANVYESDRNRAFDAGMNGFLSKPLEMDVLEAELIRQGLSRLDSSICNTPSIRLTGPV